MRSLLPVREAGSAASTSQSTPPVDGSVRVTARHCLPDTFRCSRPRYPQCGVVITTPMRPMAPAGHPPLLPLLVHRWPASGLGDLMVFASLDGMASGPASEQVSLRGTLLPLGGTAAPEHGCKASIGRPVFHLAGR